MRFARRISRTRNMGYKTGSITYEFEAQLRAGGRKRTTRGRPYETVSALNPRCIGHLTCE